ncbi:DUF1835 domain-containing protein [Paenibacillus sp. VCA1]|uniref:DUF1835 domain-containing protein n=1 Tax=Paenibacillus sp. VCA1 TaxID=3039148 RepID=UPI002870C4BC|nr:DUF1835 domain-containing protein [Paenibacillus sp. VCA1]MDR9856157.1 DUF1835 domain-containing protein [Paenibacillus sp. VCA1]
MDKIMKMKEALNGLSAQELKRLLLLTFHQVEAAARDHSAKEELYPFLKEVYHHLLDDRQNQVRRWQPDAGTKKVHILFGPSPAGSLKWALKEMGRSDTDKVISFDYDHFAFGPLYMLHTEEGRRHREEWFRDHINESGKDDGLRYEEYHGELVKQLSKIPPEASIVIWSCKNAHERTGLLWAVYLLRHHPNPITIIDADEECGKKYNTPDYWCKYKHTGEITPEKLQEVYLEAEQEDPLPDEIRRQLEEKWLELARRHEALRLWEDGDLRSVGEDYLDAYLLRTVEALQHSMPEHEFIKAARVIGQALGMWDDYIGDSFFEYRLRHLIYEGHLEIKGVPRAMRYYSVRLKKLPGRNDAGSPR